LYIVVDVGDENADMDGRVAVFLAYLPKHILISIYKLPMKIRLGLV